MGLINILVYGAGAVGIFFGGKLSKAGYNVTFIDLPERIKRLSDSGLHVRSQLDTEFDFEPILVSDLNESPPQDLIVICVKAFQTYEIGLNLIPIIKPSTIILSLQNGLENEKILADILGKNLVMGAILNFNGKLINHSTVMQYAPGEIIYGELDHQRSKREEWLSSIFARSDINHAVAQEIAFDIWEKFIWNNAFNAIGALTKTTVKQIIYSEAILPTIRQMMYEVQQVAHAEGIEISNSRLDEMLSNKKQYEDVKTPMLKDIESGVMPELEPLVGVLLRKAKEYGISTPVNRTIYNLLQLALSKANIE